MPDFPIHAFFQRRVNARALLRGMAVVLCLVALGACGKRPAQVDPPPGVSKDVYTREYPDIRTDGKQ